jgi:hypothetical protein
MIEQKRRTECETPAPKPCEVLWCLVKRERSSNERYCLCTCRERSVVVIDRATEHPSDASAKPVLINARLAIAREVDTSEVTHAAIPIDEMPAVRADSASRTTRPVVGVGRAGADDIGRVGGGVIDWLEVGSDTSERRNGMTTNLECANRG